VIGPVSQALRALAESPALREFARTQAQLQKQLDALVRSEGFARFVELVQEAEPSNWPHDRSADVIELIERTRWPLIWVPDEATIEALLDADGDDDLEAVLLERSSAIVAECGRCLDEVDESRFPNEIAGARNAIAAFDVAPMAAQAMAAITFESTLRRVLGYRSLTEAAKVLNEQKDWGDAPWPLYRWALIQSCLPDALETFRPSNGDPVPLQFNRHASVHHLGPEQYHATNAVVAVVTITAMLREIDRLIVDGHLDH
jgi:hypothetical protein